MFLQPLTDVFFFTIFHSLSSVLCLPAAHSVSFVRLHFCKEALPPGDRWPALTMAYLPSGPQDNVPAHNTASQTATESFCSSSHHRHLGIALSLQTTQGLGRLHTESPGWVNAHEGWPCFGKQWQVDFCSRLASLCWVGELRDRGTDGVRYVPE